MEPFGIRFERVTITDIESHGGWLQVPEAGTIIEAVIAFFDNGKVNRRLDRSVRDEAI